MSGSRSFTLPPLPASSSGDATSTSLFVRPGQQRAYPLGSDIGGVRSIDRTLSVVTGRQALAEAILRRLTTPLGGLIGAPSYGYDVATTIGSTVPVSVVEQRVLEQVLYEEEVEDARCSVVVDGGSLTVAVSVVDADGPFELTLTADELTVSAFIDGVPLFEEAV